MGKIIKSEYRYPIFFAGMMLMILSAFGYKYAHMDARLSGIVACIGFLLLIVSVAPL